MTSLAALACLLCCLIPPLLAAGVLAGAGWAAAGSWLPGITVILAALTGATWWWTLRRRPQPAKSGDCDGCECDAG
jgi:mercuric ion transport protein